MVKINKIKGKIVENESSIEDLATFMGVDKSTLYRKFSNSGETLSIKEANAIMAFLNLSKEEAADIFFAPDVALNATL